jgi:hypothetical protein
LGHYLEARLRPALAQYPPDLHWLGYALQVVHTLLCQRKMTLDQARSGSTQRHSVTVGQALDARRHVRCFPERQMLQACTAAYGTHHHEAGVQPHTHGQTDAVDRGEARIQRTHGRDQFEPGAYGTLGIVFVRLWPTEVHQQGTPEVLRDRAAMALDDRGAGVLIGAHHSAVVFGVKLAREGGRVGEIAEHDGELSAFGVRGGWCRGVRRRWVGHGRQRSGRVPGPHQHGAS